MSFLGGRRGSGRSSTRRHAPDPGLLAILSSARPFTDGTKLQDGATVLRAKSGGSTAVVTLVGEMKPAQEFYGTAPEHGQVPKAVRVVKDLRIAVDGKALFVPRSAYRDLGWVQKANVIQRGTGWMLVIAGGDASESFFVEILFDNTAVRKRTLFSGEADTEPLQETTYCQRSTHD